MRERDIGRTKERERAFFYFVIFCNISRMTTCEIPAIREGYVFRAWPSCLRDKTISKGMAADG